MDHGGRMGSYVRGYRVAVPGNPAPACPATRCCPFGAGHTVAGTICLIRGTLGKGRRDGRGIRRRPERTDGLATITIAALIKNDVSPETVQKVISVVVDYRDEPEPPVLFKWALGDLDEARRRKRMTAVNEMMAAASAAVSSVNGYVTGPSARRSIKRARTWPQTKSSGREWQVPEGCD